MAVNYRWFRFVLYGCAVFVLIYLVIVASNGLEGGQSESSSYTLRQLLGEARAAFSARESPTSGNDTTPSSSVTSVIVQKNLTSVSIGTVNDTLRQLYRPGYFIENAELCKGNGSSLKVLILVTSAPEHERNRMAIRYTWGHFAARKDVSIGFFLGAVDNDVWQRKVLEESELYEDIVQSMNFDSYRRLPIKTLSMLRWVDEHCPEAPFVLKTDDDVFVNVPQLLGYVRDHVNEKNTIFGLIARWWRPVRSNSKYRVTKEEFPDIFLPDFATGPAYLMTGDVVRRLYSKALDRHFLPLEDVLFTGLVARDLGIRKVHSSKFQPNLGRSQSDNCKRQISVSLHDIKYEQQFAYWSQFLDGRSKC